MLLGDIDMTGTTEWTPIGTAENPFTGKFDGKGYALKNIDWTADAAKSTAHGLFGVLNQATVRNLTVGAAGDKFTVRGTAGAGTAVAGVAAFATESVIESVTNNVSISFEAEDPAGTLVMLAGIAGQMTGTTIGGTSAAVKCANNGDITTGPIANTANGGTGMQVGGIWRLHQIGGEQPHRLLHQQRTGERTFGTRRRTGRNLREGNHRQLAEQRARSRTMPPGSTPGRRTNTASNAWAVWSAVRPRRAASSRTATTSATSSPTWDAARAVSRATTSARSATARTPEPLSAT